MAAAAAALATLWVFSGAARWNGYPVDYPNGVPVTWIIAVLVQVVFCSVGLLALRTDAPTGRVLAASIASWTIARLATASCVPLGSDEAYYWLWSRRLDWGYYDHPGMIAWFARLLVLSPTQATAAVRLASIVSGAALSAAAYWLARITLNDRAAAVRTAILLLFIPGFGANLFLLPDLIAAAFWVVTAAVAWRACQSGRLLDWLFAGAAFGLAMDAKFTALSLPAAVLVFLISSRADRRKLATPGPYAAVIAAAITFAPTLIWNARNAWPTFALHFVRRQHALAFHPEWLLGFIAVTALLLSPVIAIWAAGPGLRTAWQTWRTQHRPDLYLACLAFTPILTTLVISAMQRAHAHQVAAAYIPLIALFISRTASMPAVSRWYRHAVRVALIITMLAFAAFFVPALTPLPLATRIHRQLAPREPEKMTAEVLGWTALGNYLNVERHRPEAIIIAPSYAQASLAAQYGAADFVYSIDEGRSRYGQQLGRWSSLADLPPSTNALLFRTGHGRDEPAYEADIARLFDRIERIDTAATNLDPRLKYFAIWRGIGWHGGYQPGSSWGPPANGED